MKQKFECMTDGAHFDAFCARAHKCDATEVLVLKKLSDNMKALEGITVHELSPTKFADVSKKGIRSVVESQKVDYIFGIEDSLLVVKENINQVIAKLLHQKKVTVLFSVSKLLSLHGSARARLFKKMGDAITLFKKYKVDFYFCACSNNPEHVRGATEKESLVRILTQKGT